MIVLALIYLGLHLLSLIEPSYYLWGVDSWSYLPAMLSLLFLLIALLSLNSKIQDWLYKNIFKKDIYNFKLFIIIAFVFFVLLLTLKQSTFFLGDGYLRITNASKGIFFSASEPLDTFLHSYLAKALGISSFNIYTSLSILSGMLAITGAYYYLSKYFEDNKKIFLTLCIILTVGASQLFYGYVESYSIFTAFLILFSLSSLHTIKQKKLHYAPTIYLAFALLLHSIGIVLIPSYVYVYYKVYRKNKNLKSLLINVFLLLIIITLTVFILSSVTNVSPIDKYLEAFSSGNNLLPVFTNADSYGIISLNHLIDILNEIFLVVPAIIAIPLIIKHTKKNYFNVEIIFLSILVISFLVFLFLFKPTLGFARDWDLFSLFSFPTAILIALLLLKIREIKLYRIAIPLLLISGVHTFSWILINADEEQSLERAEFMLKTPYWANKSKALLADDLSHFFIEKKNSKKALQMSKVAYEYEKNPRYLYRMATLSYNLKNLSDADKYFKELTNADYKLASVYNYLGDINLVLKNLNRSEAYYKKSFSLDTTNLAALNNIGLINLQFAKFEKAIDMFKHSLKYVPNNSLLNYYTAISYVNLKRYDSALVYLNYAQKYGYKANIINSLRNEVLKRMGESK